ncbi:peptidase U32 [Ammoniphilus oxalaticus]|uniref:Peptidase U32 n=1 Tax=Ammoniphilus oxalaticus TaxID=66863 RepID=A0A419SJ02_9BACL|nr:peptidase U32 family protein [Ammoniphilus oxalaticus]RKD23947.1 peptidase U32 [Ammoniphilus oxalaticus]
MIKPELVTPAGNIEELTRLLDAGADAVVVGDEAYSLRLPGVLTMKQLERAVLVTRERGKKIYVAVNALFHNEMLSGLDQYIEKLRELKVDAIEYADPAVLMVAREVAPDLTLHWNPEIIATSAQTLQYWQTKGIKRAWLARELNMEEVIDIKEQSELEIGIQVHGVSCIFHSKRLLVDSYFDHLESDAREEGIDIERGLYLKEEKREDITYPIYEDQSGTHILSSDDICILDHLDELIDSEIDSFRIETLLKPIAYNEVVTRAYRQAIDLYVADPDQYYEKMDTLLASIEEFQDPKRPLTTGFFFKELIF